MSFEYDGAVTIIPCTAIAGSLENFLMTYTVGKSGIDSGSGISIFPPWGGEKIQIDDSSKPAYVSVETETSAVLKLDIRSVNTWWYKTTEGNRQIDIWNELLVEVVSGRLAAGSVIELFFHDLGSQFISQPNKVWGVREYKDEWTPRPDPIPRKGPKISYIASDPQIINLTVPSIVKPGELFDVKYSFLDSYCNPVSKPYWVSMNLSKIEHTKVNVNELSTNPVANSVKEKRPFGKISNMKIDHKGISEFTGEAQVRISGQNSIVIVGKSNPILCESAAPNNIYWGDIHIHSELSDGVGNPERAYQLARDVYHLDFCALSDHDLKGDSWGTACKYSSIYNRDGQFVTLPAYEWTSEKYGHRNVYFRSENDTVECPSSSPEFSIKELYELLRKFRSRCIVIPHHPLWHMDFSSHDPELERLIEIYSIWGSSEYRSNNLQFLSEKQPGYIHNESIREVLNRGYQYGLLASGDSHLQHPGDPFPVSKIRTPVTPATSKEGIIFGPGKMAVYAPELTRDAIWQAMYNRNCYATTGARIILQFHINGVSMGSETCIEKDPEISIFASGTDELAIVEIIKNGEVVHQNSVQGHETSIKFVDSNFSNDSWYYAKIVQNDGETAWSSPIWVYRKC
jgi:hypothetical protein